MKTSSIYLVVAFLLLAPWAQAKVIENPKKPLLEQVITIRLEGETLASALKKLGDLGGFTFSYSPDILDANRIVSYEGANKTVREVLDELFKGTIQYKERKKHIILTKADPGPKDTRKVSGYIIDEATGERLRNVSIYDPVSLSSAVTDAYGYFQIEVPKPSNEEVSLAVKKLNYADTLVMVPGGNGLLNVPIRIDKEKLNILADSVGKKLKRFWLSTKSATIQAINMMNIDDTLHRHFQFSVVPFIGTNHKLSGNIINEYSLNMLGGYSLGVEKLEIGGLFNVVRGDVRGVQIAGLANGVAGKTNGVQIAGFLNANLDRVDGWQAAGLINFNMDTVRSVALAGFTNVGLRDSRGVRVAGLANVTIGKQEGPSLAGLFNFSTGKAETQISGFLNFTAGDMTGAQVGGLVNFAARNVTGAQVSGILNAAPGRMRGAQIGFLNYATAMRGFQLGFINIADSMKGIPVGVLSFVSRGGYHKIEVSADEIFYTNIAFRTGVRQFYNIITAGAKPNTFGNEETFWTFGYGIGTAPRLSRKLFLNIDLTANQAIKGNWIHAVNMINKLYIGIDYQFARKMSITAGATLNAYVTDTTYDRYPELFTSYKPHFFVDHTSSNDLNTKMWFGGKIGLRFL
ncbi:MAG TPA: STN and carboxypeptidase regulatory-like domain-containing protein [Ohtaekwangia sp.]|uniref:STN and carboxypeptidase regulatory-like domain-containing protein n=1 Tax=Ohtaekwangia sp. TaxID=2066019 RepID=UPI002F928105